MDITKCKGEGCWMKENCKRFTAKESLMQSYFVESPIENFNCEMYWIDNTLYFDNLKKITNKK